MMGLETIKYYDSVSNCDSQIEKMKMDQLNCRQFFSTWLMKSESLQGRWQQQAAPSSSFDLKIQHLRSEIAGLAEQDTQLFRQLFALQDTIDELKEQFEVCSRTSLSPASSTRSLEAADPLQTPAHISWPERATLTSFVRQRVSYPPSARNRCRRSSPQHDSLDSGIHGSDHEIFV